MARDFFADIEPQPSAEVPQGRTLPPNPERSIRNISVPARRIPIREQSPSSDIRTDMRGGGNGVVPKEGRSRLVIWTLAALAVAGLGGAILYFTFFQRTVVEVTPRTHQVTFDESAQFTAYPEGVAAVGTISYSVEKTVIDDSTIVKASGVEKASDRATGTITVYNEYSTSPVRLIKNTRFQTPSGLVYRIPASAEVPGKKGKTPGQTAVTVIADSAGERYNVGPVDKFTLPGLKSSPDMYAGVYARSSAAMTGGFIGEKPAISQGDLENARSQLRTQLLEKARAAADARKNSATFVFPELMHITYESLPTTPEGTGSARVSERASVTVPLFEASTFSRSVAQAVSADAVGSNVMFVPREGFKVKSGEGEEILGKDAFKFSMAGSALLIWDVDVGALKQALAGRDQGAFETVIGGFSGVEKAEARIAPFWKKKFPGSVEDITVTILEPAAL